MKFTPKELIALGIFTAVYTVIYMAFNMLGAVAPILQLVGATLATLLNGITFMLFLTRVRHAGLITLMALLLGILVTIAGHHPISIVTALVAGIAADVIASRGGYRATVPTVVAYGVFNLWVAAVTCRCCSCAIRCSRNTAGRWGISGPMHSMHCSVLRSSLC